MDEITIGFAQMDDVPSWMVLVKSVCWNFPGLETEQGLVDYQKTLSKNIARKTAVCAKAGDRVVGVLMYSKNRNILGCLAVDPNYRKRGIASALIEQMMKDLDPERDVWVTTFRENDPMGVAPRALYQKLGFVADELVEEFGYPNQKFVLRRK
jgi:ribosomal protein S18 acetylase RimI-like enzyme